MSCVPVTVFLFTLFLVALCLLLAVLLLGNDILRRLFRSSLPRPFSLLLGLSCFRLLLLADLFQLGELLLLLKSAFLFKIFLALAHGVPEIVQHRLAL